MSAADAPGPGHPNDTGSAVAVSGPPGPVCAHPTGRQRLLVRRQSYGMICDMSTDHEQVSLVPRAWMNVPASHATGVTSSAAGPASRAHAGRVGNPTMTSRRAFARIV